MLYRDKAHICALRALSTPPHIYLTTSEITSRSNPFHSYFSRPSDMERRFLCKQSASRLVTADRSIRRLKSAGPYMGAPKVCPSSENPVRCPAGRVRGQERGRYNMSPEGTMSSRTPGIAWRQRQSRTEPHGGVSNIAPCKRGRAALRSSGFVCNPTQSAAECGDSSTYSHTSFVETTLLKPLLRSSTSIIHLFPHTPLNASCGVPNQYAAPQRMALNHANSLIY